GFFYDLAIPAHVSADELPRIEGEMRAIVAEDEPFIREEVPRSEALVRLADQDFKREIIEDLAGEEGEVGSGDTVTLYRNDHWVWHPRGGVFRKQLEDWVRDLHLARGYDPVVTPHIARSVLWETSGHLAKYSDNMYPPMQTDTGDYYVKPMNCPFHVLVYKSQVRSYRELPMRLSELGTIYRHERLGTLHGLLRIRGGTQDDSHIICRPD